MMIMEMKILDWLVVEEEKNSMDAKGVTLFNNVFICDRTGGNR